MEGWWKRKSPLFQEGLPVLRGIAPRPISASGHGILSQPPKLLGGAKNYFFFFLPAFFFISALSLLLDLTALVVGFFLAGIDTSSLHVTSPPDRQQNL